ncbi:MAG: hypothetical protein FWG39_00040 [Alphaproteobacteria bacterium]|nr:hypothetical protein [Alphaproteobacteria bacterium]
MKKLFNKNTGRSALSSQLSVLSSQSGRSLIETIGALAIGGVLVAITLQVYQTVSTRQSRMLAGEELREIARGARILFAGRNGFDGISVHYMVKMGALKTDVPPRMATRMELSPEPLGDGFFITLSGLNFSDCAWLSSQHFDWAADVITNDSFSDPAAENCKNDRENKVAILVE